MALTEDGLLAISERLSIPMSELEWTAVRAQGAGGQHVNKTSSAIHLRFDIRASSLPDAVKQRLLDRGDQRLSKDGVLVLKAQQSRSQEQNRIDAIERLRVLLADAAHPPKTRRATKPSRSSKRQRVDNKVLRGRVKAARGKLLE